MQYSFLRTFWAYGMKVWIIDKDRVRRNELEQIFVFHGQHGVTGKFRNPGKAISMLRETQPDAIFLNIDVEKHGLTFLSLLKKRWPGIYTVVLTTVDDREIVLSAFKAGADGYITRPSDSAGLTNAVTSALAGGSPITTDISRILVESFHRNYNTPLTRREEEILQNVAAGKTFTQISRQLLIARETTKTHVRNIYRKLEVNCRADAIHLANKNNFI